LTRQAIGHALQVLGRPHARRRHIDMRIRAIDEHRVRQVDHLPRHVRVKVERDDDGHGRPYDRTHAGEQLAFAVVDMLGHHRPMQIEIDCVHRQGGLQVVDDHARDRLISLARHLRRRHGARSRQRNDIPAITARFLGETRERQVDIQVSQNLRPTLDPAERAGLSKRGHVGLRRRERIRLVKEDGKRDTHRQISA
jgi:hypothetical protein